MGIGATAGVAAAGGIALSAQASSNSSTPASSASSSDSLVFDPDGYTKLTTTVTDTDGNDHSVTYHFWKAITYVAKPVDATYQSLIVSAPVEIDGPCSARAPPRTVTSLRTAPRTTPPGSAASASPQTSPRSCT